MTKLISSIALVLALSLSASTVSAQDNGVKVDTTEPAITFYEVVGLEGEIFFSNAEAYGAAQNANLSVIMLTVSPLTFDKK